MISVSAEGAHGIALTTTCAQLRFVGLEVEATFPHAVVPTTLIDDEMQVSGVEGWGKTGGSSEPSEEIELRMGRRCKGQGRAADAPVRRALAAVVEAAEAGLPAELDVLWETHSTLGLDRATELSGERLIGAGRLISVSAAGGHGIALATTCAQPRLVGLEVDASFPHAIVPTTLIDDEMQANGDEGWGKAGGLSEPSGEIELPMGRRYGVQDRVRRRW